MNIHDGEAINMKVLIYLFFCFIDFMENKIVYFFIRISKKTSIQLFLTICFLVFDVYVFQFREFFNQGKRFYERWCLERNK